ncbi:hypothetical protein WJX77_005313 [Trebouxia sp. C0004]
MKRSNSQMREDYAALADKESPLQQQLQMVREQVHAGPREVQVAKPTFNFYSETTTTAGGYPLSGLATCIRQGLRKSIITLLMFSMNSHWKLYSHLITASGEQCTCAGTQDEEEATGQNCLCACASDAAGGDLLIAKIIGQASIAGGHVDSDARLGLTGAHVDNDACLGLTHINELLDLLNRNSQFWLVQCQADNSLLEGCAKVTGQRLLHGLWPLENPRSVSPQFADAIVRVAEVAIQTRLHAESCHPCLKLSAVDISSSGRLFSVPGVVVYSSIAVVGQDGGVSIPAKSDYLVISTKNAVLTLLLDAYACSHVLVCAHVHLMLGLGFVISVFNVKIHSLL